MGALYLTAIRTSDPPIYRPADPVFASHSVR